MQKDDSKLKKWNEGHPQGKGELSWNKSDYEAWGYEVPERILAHPEKTEGELMSQDEIEAWLVDEFKTLSIMKEENAEIFERLYKEFVQDLQYLSKLGKIDSEAIENIKNMENFDF